MNISNFFKKYLRPDIIPLNTIQISQSAIIANYRLWKSLQPSYTIIPVLKSNAYGHGLKVICQILETINTEIDMLAVDSFPEYQIVRDHTSSAILLLNETNYHNYRYFDFSRTSFAVYTLETLKFLGSLGEDIHIHIFFNTGMNREGFQIGQIDALTTLLKQYPNLHIQGVMSHLIASQDSDQTLTNQQIESYKTMYAKLKASIVCNPSYLHISNTCALASIQDPLLTAGRVGLGLYGHTQYADSHPHIAQVGGLKPALTFTSMISNLQDVKPGDIVGYDATYHATSYRKIALVPVGYYEGLKRKAGSQRSCIVKDVDAPVCGLISMNMMSIDVTDIQVAWHDAVTVISADPNHKNTIARLAQVAECSIYEVLVGLHQGIRRIVTV